MNLTLDIILSVFTVVICLSAFIYCAIKLSKKNSSRYFVFLNLASGCYVIQEICSDIYYFCGNVQYDGLTTSTLGFIGCVLFIFAANLAILEKKIKMNDKIKKTNIIALIAPLFVVVFGVILSILAIDKVSPIILIIVLLPFCPTIYFAFKHILLEKEIEVCHKTIKSNILVLLFLLTNMAFLVAYFFANEIAITIVSVILGIEVTLLSLICVKEAKQWQI